MSAMGVTVRELVTRLRARDARLPFEIGAFVALEVSERLLEGPAMVGPDDVRIGPEGNLAVYTAPHSASSAEAAKSVASLLAHLLVAAGKGVPPVLLQLVERGPADGRWELGRLRDELEASLVPLNRSAARRVLSRIVRDVETRPRTSSRPPPVAAPLGDVDDDLDALLAVGEPDEDEELPTSQLPQLDASGNPVVAFEAITAKRGAIPKRASAQTPAAERAPTSREHDETAPRIGRSAPEPEPDEPALDRDDRGDRATPAQPPSPRREPTPLARRPSQLRPATRPLPAEELAGGRAELDDFEEDAAPQRGGMGLAVVGLLVLIVAGLAAVVVLRPDVIDRVLGRGPTEEELRAEAEAERARERAAEMERAATELRARYGRLSVRVAERERAQIFLFVGRGPAVAENLPLGVAYELVAIADGRVPTRAVVPAAAEWTMGDEGAPPLYELAMQTGDDEVGFERIVLGPSRLRPEAMGQPSTTLGRLRVVTSPPGARVFLLVGFGSTEISDLPTDRPQELLVYDEGKPPQRVFIGPSDWRPGEGGPTAEVEVAL